MSDDRLACRIAARQVAAAVACRLRDLTRELGGSLGTALMGMLISDDVKRHGSQLAERINPYNPLVQQQLDELAANAGAQTFQRELVAETLLDLKVKSQALVLSFEGGFRWVALTMALGLVLILVVRKPNADIAVEGVH